MKNYIKPEVKVYKVRIESLLSGSGSKAGGQIDCGWPQNVTIHSLMRKMMTDILVAAVFGMTKTLKIE
ncbi:hypothetical protein [Leyella stercorea]|uniref:hypothetical protein n=1 Tax=Leyella stercorea TaxID=363265 RepID=UPI00402812CA